MDAYSTGQALGALLTGVLGLVVVAGLFITVFAMPFLAWSATRSLRRIARALEQLDSAAPSGRSGSGANTLGL